MNRVILTKLLNEAFEEGCSCYEDQRDGVVARIINDYLDGEKIINKEVIAAGSVDDEKIKPQVLKKDHYGYFNNLSNVAFTATMTPASGYNKNKNAYTKNAMNNPQQLSKNYVFNHDHGENVGSSNYDMIYSDIISNIKQVKNTNQSMSGDE